MYMYTFFVPSRHRCPGLLSFLSCPSHLYPSAPHSSLSDRHLLLYPFFFYFFLYVFQPASTRSATAQTIYLDAFIYHTHLNIFLIKSIFI